MYVLIFFKVIKILLAWLLSDLLALSPFFNRAATFIFFSFSVLISLLINPWVIFLLTDYSCLICEMSANLETEAYLILFLIITLSIVLTAICVWIALSV